MVHRDHRTNETDGRRLGLRGLIAAALLLAAAALALSACFGGDDAPAAAPEPPPASEDPQTQQPAPAAAQQPAQTQQPQPVSTSDQSQTTAQTETPEPQATAEQAEPPPGVAGEYVVQSGDTLAAIADDHGVRLDDLIRINNIQNPNLLSVGQTLLIPSDEPPSAVETPAAQEEPQQNAPQAEESDEPVDTPTVTLPNSAVGLGVPITTSVSQFPQSGPDETSERIPPPPANFIQYGVDALPWLQTRTTIDDILPIFFAWPMPPLIVGDSRLNLIDTNGDGNFAAAIIFTDPNSFGAAVPFSNLVVYDPVPGRPTRYRIAYDHRLAYGREVQGLEVLSHLDLTGEGIRDITFREVSCSGGTCTNAFYILRGIADGYRVVTGEAALIDNVTAIEIADATADGTADLIISGEARDDGQPYTITLSAQQNTLAEVSRVPQAN